MKFSPGFLDDLRSRLPLSQVVSGSVQLRKSGTAIKGLCPFHKEKTPSFTVNDQKGFYHCFGCGEGGDIFDFIIKTQGLSFPEAVEKVADQCGVPLPRSSVDQEKEAPKQNWYALLEEACQWFETQLHSAAGMQARAYLKTREIALPLAKHFRLGYAPTGKALEAYLTSKGYAQEDMIALGLLGVNEERGDLYPKFRDRLIFPICDRRGRVIAFGGRLLKDGQPKYLNSPESPIFHKRRTLYNYHNALKALKDKEPFLVCEGYMDVIAFTKAGYAGAVAPLGTAMGEEQLEELWRSCSEPILCFDGDTAGQTAAIRVAQRAAPILNPGNSLKFITLPKGEDPDTLIRSGRIDLLRKLIETAKPLSSILWQSLVDEAQPSTPERRALLYKLIGKLTASIKDAGVRISYQQTLKETFSAIYGKKSSFRSEQKPSSSISGVLNPRFDPTLLRQRLLLVTILNHPVILHGIIEKFTTLDLSVAEIDNLRHDIIQWAEENNTLDKDELKAHLYAQGYRELFELLVRPDLYIHGRFASPESTDQEALDGWKDIYKTMVYDRQAKQDISQVEMTLATSMSESTWQRLKELKKVSLDDAS